MLRSTLAAALALTAGMALAQTAAPTAPAPQGGASEAGSRQNRAQARYQAIQAARVSIAQAIDAAEAQGGGGGRAVEAEFEAAERNEPTRYEVKVLHADGRLVEHHVDASSGQVTKSENQPAERYFTRLRPEDVRGARTSLKQAIAAAESRAGVGARAVEAEIEREGGSIAYEIDVATPDRTREFKVNADGQVTGG